jgi:hypothetical protein
MSVDILILSFFPFSNSSLFSIQEFSLCIVFKRWASGLHGRYCSRTYSLNVDFSAYFTIARSVRMLIVSAMCMRVSACWVRLHVVVRVHVHGNSLACMPLCVAFMAVCSNTILCMAPRLRIASQLRASSCICMRCDFDWQRDCAP